MKIVPFLLGILFLVQFSTGSFAYNLKVQQASQKVDSLQLETVLCYQVFGMDCPGCQSALEKQIKKIEGVQEVKANWKKKEVIITVKVNTKISEEAIFERIKKANFTPGKKIEIVNKSVK